MVTYVELPLQAVRVRAVGVVRCALALPRASNSKAFAAAREAKQRIESAVAQRSRATRRRPPLARSAGAAGGL